MSHEQSNQPQFSSSDPIEEQRRWGARTLRLQGLLTVFSAFAYACILTPLVPPLTTILLGFVSAAVSAFLFHRNLHSSEDRRWYVIPAAMTVETTLAIVMLWQHATYYLPPILFAAGLLLLFMRLKPLAYGRLLAFAIFSGIMLGNINSGTSMGVISVGLTLVIASTAQLTLLLAGVLKVFSARWQKAFSIALFLASIAITVLAAFLAHLH